MTWPTDGAFSGLLGSLIPVLGTLLGAMIGGGLSLLAQRASARYSRGTQALNIAEERARWAAERRLDELKRLYSRVAEFQDATEEFRIHQARTLHNLTNPKERKEQYDSTRGRWELSLRALHDDVLIFDRRLYDAFREALQPRQQWFICKTAEEGLDHLQALEHNLVGYRRQIAEEYRRVFLARETGTDGL